MRAGTASGSGPVDDPGVAAAVLRPAGRGCHALAVVAEGHAQLALQAEHPRPFLCQCGCSWGSCVDAELWWRGAHYRPAPAQTEVMSDVILLRNVTITTVG